MQCSCTIETFCSCSKKFMRMLSMEYLPVFPNLEASGEFGKYYSLPALNDPRIDKLPHSIRILLESFIRNCDGFQVTKEDVEKIIDWKNTSPKLAEIPFKPDFTGVPAVVELSCMNDAMNKIGSDSNKINPLLAVLTGDFRLSGACVSLSSLKNTEVKSPALMFRDFSVYSTGENGLASPSQKQDVNFPTQKMLSSCVDTDQIF